MNKSSDADRGEPDPPRPRWPLDLVKSLAQERPYFDRPKGLGVQAGDELEVLLQTASPRLARLRGQALVQALRAADFLGTTGAGDAAQDCYAATYGGRRLRLGLSPYRFSGQPAILMIEITALPDGNTTTAGAGG